jgi:hypothetical protein
MIPLYYPTLAPSLSALTSHPQANFSSHHQLLVSLTVFYETQEFAIFQYLPKFSL